MKGTHNCPGGCGDLVRDVMFACYDCWGELPGPRRSSISRTAHLPLTDPRRRAAVTGAVSWYQRLAEREEGRTIPPEWAGLKAAG